MIQPIHAVLLGIVEGLTEFLPVSSTGHLILTASALGLHGEAIKTFEVVIQAGAIMAVVGLYWARVVAMWQGLWGQDAEGRRLLVNLLISFVPAAVVGVVLHHAIKGALFSPLPVIVALTVGGIVMIGFDAWWRRAGQITVQTVTAITPWQAVVIGAAQCLALWPGTSRAMVTIVAGMLLGLRATVAAEYSFLLALPTLGAAALFDAATSGGVLRQEIGTPVILYGFLTALVVAVLAMRGFVSYLTRHGLAPFGWYRLGVAVVFWLAMGRG